MKKTTTTKTKSQRMFAMAMAAAMVVSMAPVTAFAEESAPADGNGGTSQAANGENASGNGPTVTITVTKSDDGSETKETKSESTNESGASVTETKTETTAADGTTSERTETTTTTTTTEDNEKGGTTTTVDSATEYKETTTQPAQTEPENDDAGSEGEAPEGNEPAEGNTETGYVDGNEASEFEEGTTTDVTTETEGSESGADTTVTDHKDRVVEESGESSGSETTTETETVTEKHIEDRDELENDDYIEGEEKTLEDTEGNFDNDGSVDTEENETSKSIDPGYAGDITITLTPGSTGTGSAEVDENALYEDLLADDRPESSETKGEAQVEDVTDDDGNKIGTKTTTTDEKTDVKDVTNKDGAVVGYETTKTTTTTVVTETAAIDVNPIDTTVETGETTTTTSEPVETIHLPERPADGESRNDAGETTKTTVEDITDDDGNVVGYNISTVTTNAAGEEIARGNESIWGTKTVTVTTTETLETTTTKTEYITTTTTTTDITEGKMVNGEWITSTPRQATASMGQVTVGEANGTNDLQALDIDLETLLANLDTNDLRDSRDYVEDKQIDGELFHYVGLLAGSDYRIYRKEPGPEGYAYDNEVYIFVLKDADGNEFYGYCADLATTAKEGTLYEIANIEDETYYQGQDAEDHIRAIALNGFWGTASGTGSLDAVKQLLKDANYADWDTLTEGQAMAATQAAMWKFGNNGNAAPPVESNVSSYDYNWKNIEGTQGDKNIQKLYEILVSKTAPADTSTNILDTSDIIGSAITIKDKAEDERNNDADTTNDVYNTDISFTVALIPDANDNLTAVVYQGDKEIGRQALTAENGTTENGNTTYTLNGLTLQEGVNINLSLEGTQNLKKGVYLYTAELGVSTSQTFVGVAEGKRTVDMDVSMTFEVDDEAATHHKNSGSNRRSKQDKKVTQTTGTAINEEVVAMMEITTVTVTELDSEWEEEYKEEFQYNDDTDREPDDREPEEKDPDEERDTDGEKDPDGDREPDGDGTETFIIDDDDVPLAELPEVEIPLGDFVLDDVPKTNDASALWLALSGFSGIGLAGLFGRKRRK